MAKVVITEDGIKRYYNEEGSLHREDGPALISKNGTKFWYINGNDDSVNDNPAERLPCGDVIWLKHSQLHRTNGPSLMYPNGYKRWYSDRYVMWPKL